MRLHHIIKINILCKKYIKENEPCSTIIHNPPYFVHIKHFLTANNKSSMRKLYILLFNSSYQIREYREL